MVQLTENNQEVLYFEVSNALGQQVLTQQSGHFTQHHRIDTRSLSPGIYFLKVRGLQERARKFVISF